MFSSKSLEFFLFYLEEISLPYNFCYSSFTAYYNTAFSPACINGSNQSFSLQRGLEIFIKSVEDFNHGIFCDFGSSPSVGKLSVAGSGEIKEQLFLLNVTHVTV